MVGVSRLAKQLCDNTSSCSASPMYLPTIWSGNRPPWSRRPLDLIDHGSHGRRLLGVNAELDAALGERAHQFVVLKAAVGLMMIGPSCPARRTRASTHQRSAQRR